MRRYEGRVALVTGGARGIGAAIVRRLAAEGGAVAVLDLEADNCLPLVDEVRSAGGLAVAVGADVAETAQVEDAVTHVVDELGRLDVLVNNAGVLRDNLVHKMSDDDWDTVLAVHLRGAFLCSRAAQRVMVAQRYGRIVSLSSTSSDGNRGQANYAAAKAGIKGLTRTLALELGRFGVTVNAVAPGFIRTAMTQQTAARVGVSFEQFAAGAAAAIAAGRVGEPEDVAAAVAFLASEEAGFVNGHTLYVDGGGRS